VAKTKTQTQSTAPKNQITKNKTTVKQIQAKIPKIMPPIPSPISGMSASDKSRLFVKSGICFELIFSAKSFVLSLRVMPLYNPIVINKKKSIEIIVVEIKELK
jgi:hypothetical protein